MELPSSITGILWIGFGGMVLGTAIIYFLSMQLKATEKYHAYTAMAITSIAAMAYYAMANSQAIFTVAGKSLFLGRYIDWVITTPLLLLSLCFLAYPASKDGESLRQKLGVIASAVFADIVMIVTGAFANASTDSGVSNFWYAIGCLAFIVILAIMYGPIRQTALKTGASAGKLYTNMLNYLMVLFFIYPIVWILGTSGNGTIDLKPEVAIYTVLDLLAKVVFGIAIVVSISNAKSTE